MHLKCSKSLSLARARQKRSSQVEGIKNMKCYFQTALYKTAAVPELSCCLRAAGISKAAVCCGREPSGLVSKHSISFKVQHN